MNSILWCSECGETLFNKHKLRQHMIEEHGYAIPLEEDKDGRESKARNKTALAGAGRAGKEVNSEKAG